MKTTQEKIEWAKTQLQPIELKDLKGKKIYFKLVKGKKGEVSNASIGYLIGKTRQNVVMQRYK